MQPVFLVSWTFWEPLKNRIMLSNLFQQSSFKPSAFISIAVRLYLCSLIVNLSIIIIIIHVWVLFLGVNKIEIILSLPCVVWYRLFYTFKLN